MSALRCARRTIDSAQQITLEISEFVISSLLAVLMVGVVMISQIVRIAQTSAERRAVVRSLKAPDQDLKSRKARRKETRIREMYP
ncbi:hypothetical protein KZC52_07095 [Microbacterium sp. kSW2-24]|uniref:hypothetical protein n=1 Tax=Microbacterium galbinum TaxID=2851646 RepID=UPI001FFDB57B|nr:hypothetical protein [Microbacterium galbinum]MCK2022683.1 hypothetical protein [Microbacterium galbinum]